MLATLRQPRYLGLFGLMLVVATLCCLAGSWQVIRFGEKHRANHELRHNNKDVLADVSTVLGPADQQISDGHAQQFRHVTATGTYLAASQTLWRGQNVNGDAGYVVITPLRTTHGVLLIARGFVPLTASASSSPQVSAPPDGQVTVTVRLQPGDSHSDRFATLPTGQIETVNPSEQSQRLHSLVWNGYGELLDSQPGTAGLQVIPGPDLSNPAGGAVEPQHAAYVVQWFLFAGLALAAPFVLANAESRRDRGSGGPRGSDGSSGSDASDRTGRSARAARKARKASLDDRLAGRS